MTPDLLQHAAQILGPIGGLVVLAFLAYRYYRDERHRDRDAATTGFNNLTQALTNRIDQQDRKLDAQDRKLDEQETEISNLQDRVFSLEGEHRSALWYIERLHDWAAAALITVRNAGFHLPELPTTPEQIAKYLTNRTTTREEDQE